ncbi:MAG: RHS repeat-associated core domain-containing protein, partial [Pseudomonadota bacterium]
IIDNFYNWAGHKIKSQHPDQGTWIYSYDALGQMQSQTDSKQQKQSFTYDVLGRTLTHTTSEGITKWIYDAGENAKGQTVRTEHPNVIRQFYYDNFSRVSRTQTTIGQNTYNQSTVYDTFGRVQRINYPNSLSIGFQYDPNLGYLIRKDNLTEARSVWKLKEMDAQGRVTQNSLGNGVWITNYYDPHTGYLIGNKSVLGTQIKTYFDYSYDRVGNLIERHDNQQSTSEYFHYDNLNRLKQSQTDSSGIIHTVKLTYNALGNIITKSDVGNYSYGVAQNTSTQVRTDCFGGPHAAIKIADKPFCYDANGNLTQDDQRTLQFNSENLSTSIRHTNGNASQLIYGPGKELVVRRDTDPMGAQTEVIYLGDVEIIKKSSLSDQYRYRVGSEVALTSNANSPTTIQSKFQILDHLESVIAILDINGNIENKYSYDAWGKRRNINWQPSSNILYGNWITAAGFTGHEHLDAIGLIHMNGRIYNPTIGRFVSADPVIQAPTDLQSYNGYAYARNNPLKFTDPTGYSWLSKQWNKFTNFLDKHWKTIIIVGVTFMVGGLAATSFGAAGYGKILTGALVAGISSFTANIIGGLLHGANMIDSFKAGFSSVPKAMAMGAVISATLEAIYRAVTPHINQEVELYDITNKKPIKLDPTTINNESAVIFASGQNNSLEYAAGLAKTYTNNQATHLIYNPTVSGFADTVESVLEKLTGRGPGSESFANNLKGFNLKNSTLYVHSQAGITSRNALMLLHTQGVDVAGLKVSMHGAAVNKISTQILFNRMDVNMIGFNAHALDAVPNILGYNALTIPNPYRLVGSILASPLLFKGGEWSPHTNPGGGKNLNMFPSWY